MKCRTCGNDTAGSMRFCQNCLYNWSKMRKVIWDYHEKKYGKLTGDNLLFRQKDTKRLEKIWRKNTNDFIVEIENGGSK